ncbi:hypothetical protein [Delftia acidovorans]|uniref:Uncharacterized protein n=1 Tax=Delftia acidovorans TaxID=80866 RepID=A0AAJ2VDT2_DELAC|nr:hypothetical protein [Delftia acidovorans]MDX4957917.1 hypothetical protein [Delftia acidovorans]
MDSSSAWGLKKISISILKSLIIAWVVSRDNSWTGSNVFQKNTYVEGETGPEVDLGIRAYGRAPVLHGYLANGTKASPSATTINQLVLGVGGRSWTGTQWSEHSTAAIHFATTENHSDTAQGTNVAILATPIGSGYADRVKVAEFNGDGDIINSRGITQRKINSGERGRGIEIYREGGTAEFSMVSTSSVPYASLCRGYSVGGSAAGGYSATVSGQGTGYALCGHDGTGFVGAKAIVGLHAGANWTTTSTPTRIEFQTTVTGSTARATRLAVDEVGNVVVATGMLGYANSALDVVTQTTSKTEPVAINKRSGVIVTHPAELAGGASALFRVSNTFATPGTHIVLTLTNSSGSVDSSIYRVKPILDETSAGFYVLLTNESSSAMVQAVRFKFILFGVPAT